MTAPDLPMRERISEALFMAQWLAEDDQGARDTWRMFVNDGVAESVHPSIYRQADAVLDLWADLPDTAVEAGAEEVRGHVKYLGHCYDGATGRRLAFCTGCDWDHIAEADDVDAAFAEHHTRAVLTAVIAAFKEGKA